MECLTSLSEFRVSATDLVNPEDCKTIQLEVSAFLKECNFKEAHDFTTDLGPGRGFFRQYLTPAGAHASLRGHPSGLVILDIQEFVEEGEKRTFTEEVIGDLEEKISKSLKAKSTKRLPTLHRGSSIEQYFPTTDGKIIEYDFDELVYEQNSKYQNVKIFHSPQFGNMLILDNDPNLAESDLVYTQTITGSGKEDYRDKTVLILGGGDGGILHELRKENPSFITMVDIDEVVVTAAQKYLRGICYDSLDELKGKNYEVLLDDCVPILQDYIKQGRTFDFVINDLTAIPVTTEPVGEFWDFLRLILDLSMKVLAPHGKYYTQGNGANMKGSLSMYEAQLTKLSCPVHFKTKTVFVPSYHEMWVFYEIWKK